MMPKDVGMDMDVTLELDAGQGYLDQASNAHGEVQCVFSSLEKIKVGTGTTTRTHYSKLFWYVEQTGDREFTVRRINDNHVPAGDESTISLDELLQEYTPEVEFYEEQALPAMQYLEENLSTGEALRKEGRLYSAESCFDEVLMIEEKNVRALFNLGLIYLEVQDIDKAKDMMRELLLIKAAFKGKNQFLFNEFGIALRKAGLFDEAVEYYAKASEFAPEDENLFYNLARANYERGDWEQCGEALARSQRLNPELAPALKLGRLVVKLHDNPDLCKRHGKPPVPADILSMLSTTKKPEEHPSFHKPSEEGQTIKRARGEAEASGTDEFFDI